LEAEVEHPRSIRSFVLRAGRLSPAQNRALETLMPRWGVPVPQNGTLDFKTHFGREAPVALEIGFGMGESTVTIAQALPDVDFLALDVHPPGVGNLLKRIEEEGVTNIRVMRHDAVEVVEQWIAPGSLSRIHIFFPDPWPKARHHKRRLVQSPFVHTLAQRLKPGGVMHLATDWENYAEQMLEVLSAEPLLKNQAEGYSPRPDYRPLTKFEQRGLRLGHGVWDLLFERI
jgi:tRNA (guanine-N7-)-methyltransferase